MNKLIILTLLLLGINLVACDDYSAFGADIDKLVTLKGVVSYNKWRQTNNRAYISEEERIYRQIVFLQNSKQIEAHNNDSSSTHKLALNQFADMTSEEFSQRILNHNLGSYSQSTKPLKHEFNNAEIPEIPSNESNGSLRGALGASSFDWRNYGAIGPIKNQGQCGSCWTFATTGVVESLYFIKYRQLPSFSEQNIVDCASRTQGYNSDGCNGGFPAEGLYYASRNGVVPSSSYPYVGFQGSCRNVNASRFYLRDQYYQVAQSQSSLQYAISRAPVSVAVDASTWQFYNGGVYNGCGQTQRNQLNHAVIAIGYDAQGNWLVRNSWGTGWGQSGYITLASGNTCGILYDNYAFNI